MNFCFELLYTPPENNIKFAKDRCYARKPGLSRIIRDTRKRESKPLKTQYVWSLALVAAAIAPTGIRASCSVSGTTATCTGSPGSISYTDGSVETIEIDNLTADISGGTAIELTDTGSNGSGHGKPGDNGADLEIDASTGSQNIIGTSDGVVIESTGGDGHDGEDKNAVIGNETGGSGGAGGSGGTLTLDISGTSTTVSGGDTAITGTSQGGDGAKGGEGSSEAGEGYGGKGGAGGSGGEINVTLSAAASVSDGSTGIVLQSLGGIGGEGGEGGGEAGEGGKGGIGGDSGDISLTADSYTATIKTDIDDGYGIEASSMAGSGGKGGEGTGIDGKGGEGGGGGTSGNVTVSAEASISTGGDEAVGILIRSYGGNGGDGGSADGIVVDGGAANSPGPAGNVALTFQGSIATAGSQATGILAQSVGGFAGDSGSSVGLIAFGANEQSGGDAGDISVTLGDNSTVSITTMGDYATGVEVNSIGGGGGVGTVAVGAFSQLGGEGSAGGDGGSITFSVDHGDSGKAKIVTSGDRALGVVGLSTGGGGGSSGTAIGITALGGSGGTGGNGGDVSAYLGNLYVETSGTQADAVYFASIGGGGGSGGSTGGIVSMGSSGGSGGDGGNVDVTGLEGTISTTGDDADTMLVQSVGGGGGKGTNAIAVGENFSLAHGGSGGDGGFGGSVTYTDADQATASMTTTGNRARGLVVQSIGGGGGSAGYATSISAGVIFNTSIGITSGGGTGADAGTVEVKAHASIATAGSSAAGLLAQSVGGGGGSVGNTVSIGASALNDLNVATAIGGSGGDGGNGEDVTIDVEGDITTSGDESTALLAQSIGGGGGNSSSTWAATASVGTDASISFDLAVDGGGGGGGDAGNVSANSSGTIVTMGDNSDGVFLQSIGGGGGSGGTSGVFGVALSSVDVDIAIGGNGGNGGNAGAVTLASSSAVTTSGSASSGIKVQSIGGSGGDGSLLITGDAISTGNLTLTLGGSGGDASDASDVTVVSSGAISTQGKLSEGILAQSIGGGGGSAGSVISASALEMATLDLEISGTSGSGGIAGAVSLDNSGIVTTTAASSSALTAQSIGGGGGSANVVVDVDALTTQSATFAMGNSGGDGGAAGEVGVSNLAALETSGDYSYGILAQSLAGSGGSGTSIINASVSQVTSTSSQIGFAIGGDGGDGGTSSTVSVQNGATVITGGYGAHGILAQSSGGDGGAGGSVTAATLLVSTDTTTDLSLDVGGSGGSGGSAGDIEVVNLADVATEGDLADAIFAESVGGGGGAGGGSYSYLFSATSSSDSATSVNVSISVGGAGGSGGSQAGNVTVTNAATLSTSGGDSNAITAMSVGGMGGDGGAAVNYIANFTVSSSQTFSGTAAVNIGGSGGAGHVAGSVAVDNDGNIVTSQDTSSGVYASSIGGGGGAGGNVSAMTFGTTKATSAESSSLGLSLNVSVGGSGGTGGDGDTATIANTGTILTTGTTSYGIFAQSIGGGGGSGGNGSFGLNGFGSVVSDMSTVVKDANEIYNDYQSLSALYRNVSFDMGGSGGAAGSAGAVSVDNSGLIYTQGDSATAIYAQSIGGGGGTGGDGGGGLITAIDLAGLGSGGGDGGAVDVTNDGSIVTEGYGAMGIVAQSVGGGGGAAGDIEGSLVADLVNLSIGVAEALGADIEGDGGNGGTVTIEKTGDIVTTGDYAHAVWAQSVGGGGGAAAIIGLFDTITFGGVGSSGDSGTGGAISVTVDGNVAVSGDYAHGVFAQSTSGGGGGSAGDVTIDVTGSIVAGGSESRAILAQSEGSSSSGAIAISIAEGSTVQGSDDGYETIGLMDGSGNTIDNAGSILGPSDSDRVYAIHTELSGGSSGGDLTIGNSGIITGSIYLNASESNSLANTSGGTLNTGPTIDLGSVGKLTNSGALSPGGAGTVQASTITGVVTQTGTGSFLADIEMSSSATGDMIVLESSGASFAGTVNPNVVSYDSNSGSSGSLPILTADSGTIDASSLSVTDSATVDFSLSGTGTDTVNLTYSVDISAAANLLPGRNGRSTASYLDRLIELGKRNPDAYSFLDALVVPVLNAATVEELKEVLEALTYEEAVMEHQSIRNANLSFNSALRSCPAFNENGVVSFNREGECAWLRFGGGTLQRVKSTDQTGFDENIWNAIAGSQVRVGDGFGDDLFVGIAGSYQSSNASNSGYTASGDLWQAGTVLKQEYGPTTFSASLAGGFYTFDTRRDITILGPVTAEGNPDGWMLSTDIRASHQFNLYDGWYAKPVGAVTVSQIWQNGFTETGAGAANIEIDALEQLAVVLSPQLEIGRENETFRGYLRLGASYYLTGNDTDVSMRFAAQSQDSPWLTLTEETDELFGDLTLGLDTLVTDNVTFSLIGNGFFSQNSVGFGGAVKIRMSF